MGFSGRRCQRGKRDSARQAVEFLLSQPMIRSNRSGRSVPALKVDCSYGPIAKALGTSATTTARLPCLSLPHVRVMDGTAPVPPALVRSLRLKSGRFASWRFSPAHFRAGVYVRAHFIDARPFRGSRESDGTTPGAIFSSIPSHGMRPGDPYVTPSRRARLTTDRIYVGRSIVAPV